MKRTSFVVVGTIIIVMLAVISLAYNPIPSANSVNSTDTGINPAVPEWQLTVTGLVDNPLNLSWAEIVAMPKTTVNAALVCVDMPDYVVAEGNWTGIKLRILLEEAEISAEAIKVGFHAADGYSTDLTVETAMRDDIILAYEKDGEPLNEVLRLVVPGKWGYKWISQVTSIGLVSYNFLGFWESEGYSDEADITLGVQRVGDLQSLFPVPSPTPTPTTSPSPSPSQPPVASPAPLQQPTPTPKAPEGLFLPIEAVYAIASSVAIVIVVFGVIVVRKRAK